MQTYFVRHTRKLDIDAALRERLWTERLIAVHCAHDKTGRKDRDSESTEPDDYAGFRRSAMKTLVRLAQEGGYVCAQYHRHEESLVGRIPPGTAIQLIRGRWGTLYGAGDREAVLKALQLDNVRVIDPSDSPGLLVGRPRQGTIMRWPNAGNLIKNLVEGITSDEFCLANLTPTEQEVLCSEFLRTDSAATMGLPKMEALLLPVGRTMKDIDIFGIAADGRSILAQVTFSTGKRAKRKADRLAVYSDARGSHRILFSQAEPTQRADGLLAVSIEEVIDRFRATSLGKLWFEQIMLRRRAKPAGQSCD